jgi:uncharacterized protein YecE (DUF72 family)
MRLSVGTSGYSYKEWLGRFYPEKLPATQMLGFYAQHFGTVEINNTFYRMPAESMLTQWLEQVPESFTFTLKAPKRITHVNRLRESESNVTEFLRRSALLGERLGAILFQLPPFLKKDAPRLRDFLAQLPQGQRFAFEFRSDTWHDDEVFALLRDHDASLCVTDTDVGETPFIATSACGYLRLRRTHYEVDELHAWARRIAERALPHTYVYFMHEDEALGTRFARQLTEAWTAR